MGWMVGMGLFQVKFVLVSIFIHGYVSYPRNYRILF
jgi:hypothetical protein